MKRIILTLVLSVLSFGANAALVNLAPTGTAYASGSAFGGTSPQNAIDESLSTTWNSGGYATQWITINLGTTFQISEIRANVAQNPDGYSLHKIYLDGALAASWNDVTVNGEWLTHTFGSPLSAEYIRIETISSYSWVAWNEIEIYANVVPIPAAVWLFASGLGLLGWFRRRALKSQSF